MNKKVDSQTLGLVKALQTISKYRASEGSHFDGDVMSLIDALLETAHADHKCPRCGTNLRFYVSV